MLKILRFFLLITVILFLIFLLGLSWFSLKIAAILIFSVIFALLYMLVFSEGILIDAFSAYNPTAVVNLNSHLFGLKSIVERIAFQRNQPIPEIFIITDSLPIVFSLGYTSYRWKIFVSSGLLSRLNDDELYAILHHEFVRLQRSEILINTFVGAILFSLLNFFYDSKHSKIHYLRIPILILVMPAIVGLMRSVARSDKEVAQIDQNVLGSLEDGFAYASALRKIDNATPRYENQSNMVLQLAASHLYVVNPLLKHSWLSWIWLKDRPRKRGVVSYNTGINKRISKLLVKI